MQCSDRRTPCPAERTPVWMAQTGLRPAEHLSVHIQLVDLARRAVAAEQILRGTRADADAPRRAHAGEGFLEVEIRVIDLDAPDVAVGDVVDPANKPLPNPKVIENWGELPNGRMWGSTAGVDIGPDGHVWAYGHLEIVAGRFASGRRISCRDAAVFKRKASAAALRRPAREDLRRTASSRAPCCTTSRG